MREDRERRQILSESADLLDAEAHDRRLHAVVGPRIRTGQRGGDGLELRPRLVSAHAVGQTAEHVEPPIVTRLRLEPRKQGERQPESFAVGELESVRHDADDGGCRAVDQDRSPEHRGIAAVAAGPEPVSEDHDGWRIAPIVACDQPAPEHRRDAENAERVGRDVGPATLSGERPGSLMVIRPPANAASDAKLREARRKS